VSDVSMRSRLVVVAAGVLLLPADVCSTLDPTSQPTPPSVPDSGVQVVSGYDQCASSSQMPLYCATSTGPQVLQGVPGECCYVGAGATSQTGYICVYGNDDSTGAVCGDMATIADSCPPTGAVIKCCAGSAC
jgi:hypothetical protein